MPILPSTENDSMLQVLTGNDDRCATTVYGFLLNVEDAELLHRTSSPGDEAVLVRLAVHAQLCINSPLRRFLTPQSRGQHESLLEHL